MSSKRTIKLSLERNLNHAATVKVLAEKFSVDNNPDDCCLLDTKSTIIPPSSFSILKYVTEHKHYVGVTRIYLGLFTKTTSGVDLQLQEVEENGEQIQNCVQQAGATKEEVVVGESIVVGLQEENIPLTRVKSFIRIEQEAMQAPPVVGASLCDNKKYTPYLVDPMISVFLHKSNKKCKKVSSTWGDYYLLPLEWEEALLKYRENTNTSGLHFLNVVMRYFLKNVASRPAVYRTALKQSDWCDEVIDLSDDLNRQYMDWYAQQQQEVEEECF